MRKLCLATAISVSTVCAAWAVKPSAFGNQSKPVKATVRILAISSSSRQNFAGNQEIYLADVQVKDGEHQFARLVDQYPGFGLPIRTSLLQARTTFAMLVTREPECDITGAQIFLHPGTGGVYDSSVRTSLQAHESIAVPCFKTLHQTIALPKK